ncbi:MAG TPA: LysR family transcriptional regulator [Candidatus Anaerostipes excrementavium]|uniref:LysR family transcriptional regulator n=1 Tax=Candidatus Anaerostipes excrementavium TaxID=2838463 RepID=A0A9D1WX32_9FIRM|nr:LysR family transcriptional regulator [uncultured Anaerostipes sp.]HIX68601.1 LysR family transcriptional regulator [Candidatus Anaerostipes excrementavium]
MLSQQLQIFLEVVDSGSFTKASKRLLVTPASVMKHMNKLENRLGLTLFKRSNHGVQLTAAGKSLYEDGKKMLSQAEDAIVKAKNAALSEGITIRVGSSLLNPSSVLTNLWAPIREKYPEYKFRIIPYEDKKEQILSVTASLGERIDLLVGSFNSRAMQKRANYLFLGNYQLCVAVPKGHPLSYKKQLTFQDLHGERLVMVKSGDTELLDYFRTILNMTHPQILITDTDYYYDIDTFNMCEQTGMFLLTLDAWSDVHPFLTTLPVEWDYQMPYGILYSKNPSKEVEKFIAIIKKEITEKNV